MWVVFGVQFVDDGGDVWFQEVDIYDDQCQ